LLRFNQVNSITKFPWLSKEVKYQSKPLLIEEFFDASLMISINFLNPTTTAVAFGLKANSYL